MKSDESSISPYRTRLRRLASGLALLAASGLATLIALGLAGQAIRDRSVATALMMYIPLMPVGLAAVALDLSCRGRSLPWKRFGLTLVGCVAIGWSATCLIGTGAASERRAGDEEITVLHWNVLWGGGPFRGPMTWKSQRSAIVGRSPDLVVLSEAPPPDWLTQLTAELGEDATYVGTFHEPGSPYWYRMAVCSRWPLRLEEKISLPGGSAMSVTAKFRGRSLRILVVDGASSPWKSRLPFLHALNEVCRKATAKKRPYDMILGDFNTPSRSIGFDELVAQGYRLAGWSSTGWRATFPSWFPVYDIDHIWLSPGLRIVVCRFFSGPWSDHRGQVVGILIGAPRASETGDAVRLNRSASDPAGPRLDGPGPTSSGPASSSEAGNP